MSSIVLDLALLLILFFLIGVALLIVRAIPQYLLAIVAALVTYYLFHNAIYAGIVFLVVALLTLIFTRR